MTTAQELLPVWRGRAELLRRHGASEAACTLDVVAEELEAVLRAAPDELLTLTAAARVSGYSADHLGRLVKRRVLRNYGRPNAPRLRQSELPAKPGWLPPDARPTHVLSARERIARAVVISRPGA